MAGLRVETNYMMEPLLAFSIIIPVYNEVENVGLLYDDIEVAIPKDRFIYEVIFVDDGSVDGTALRLSRMSKQNSTIKVIHHAKNLGQSVGLLTGAQAAQYSTLVTLDGDGQNDPRDIPHLLKQLNEPKTIVLGIREKRNDNRLRRFSSWVANSVRRSLLDDDCPDSGCGLKIFPRDAFLTLPHFNHFHRFLPALFKRAGYRLVHVPVNHRPRWHGVSKYGIMNRLFVGIYDLIGVRWLLKRPCLSEHFIDEN